MGWMTTSNSSPTPPPSPFPGPLRPRAGRDRQIPRPGKRNAPKGQKNGSYRALGASRTTSGGAYRGWEGARSAVRPPSFFIGWAGGKKIPPKGIKGGRWRKRGPVGKIPPAVWIGAGRIEGSGLGRGIRRWGGGPREGRPEGASGATPHPHTKGRGRPSQPTPSRRSVKRGRTSRSPTTSIL